MSRINKYIKKDMKSITHINEIIIITLFLSLFLWGGGGGQIENYRWQILIISIHCQNTKRRNILCTLKKGKKNATISSPMLDQNYLLQVLPIFWVKFFLIWNLHLIMCYIILYTFMLLPNLLFCKLMISVLIRWKKLKVQVKFWIIQHQHRSIISWKFY